MVLTNFIHYIYQTITKKVKLCLLYLGLQQYLPRELIIYTLKFRYTNRKLFKIKRLLGTKYDNSKLNEFLITVYSYPLMYNVLTPEYIQCLTTRPTTSWLGL